MTEFKRKGASKEVALFTIDNKHTDNPTKLKELIEGYKSTQKGI